MLDLGCHNVVCWICVDNPSRLDLRRSFHIWWIVSDNPSWLLQLALRCNRKRKLRGVSCNPALGNVRSWSCNPALGMCCTLLRQRRRARDHRQVVTAGGGGLLGHVGHSCRGGIPSVGRLQQSIGFELRVQVRAGWPAWWSGDYLSYLVAFLRHVKNGETP